MRAASKEKRQKGGRRKERGGQGIRTEGTRRKGERKGKEKEEEAREKTEGKVNRWKEEDGEEKRGEGGRRRPAGYRPGTSPKHLQARPLSIGVRVWRIRAGVDGSDPDGPLDLLEPRSSCP